MIKKLFSTVGILARLLMARTFGDYVHTLGGPSQPDVAVYRWRGKLWWIPTGAVS